MVEVLVDRAAIAPFVFLRVLCGYRFPGPEMFRTSLALLFRDYRLPFSGSSGRLARKESDLSQPAGVGLSRRPPAVVPGLGGPGRYLGHDRSLWLE